MISNMKGITIAYLCMAMLSLVLFAVTYTLLYCYAFIAFGLGFVLCIVGLTVMIGRGAVITR